MSRNYDEFKNDLANNPFVFLMNINNYRDSRKRGIIEELFSNPEEFAKIAGGIAGYEWRDILIYLAKFERSDEDDSVKLLAKSIIDQMFFDKQKFDVMAKNLFGNWWEDVIASFSTKTAWCKPIIELIFRDNEMFATMASVLDGKNWTNIIKSLVYFVNDKDFNSIVTQMFLDNDKFNIMAKGMSNRAWNTLYFLKTSDKNSYCLRGLIRNAFLNPLKFKVILEAGADFYWADIKKLAKTNEAIRNNLVMILKYIWFSEHKTWVDSLIEVMTGKDWTNFIASLSDENELNISILNDLFSNHKRLSLMTKAMSGDDWINLIKKFKTSKGEFWSKIINFLNDNFDKSTKELIFKQIGDYIYYNDNTVSLNSKKLFMIQQFTEFTSDYDFVVNFIAHNYRFDLRKVDIKRKKRQRLKMIQNRQ